MKIGTVIFESVDLDINFSIDNVDTTMTISVVTITNDVYDIILYELLENVKHAFILDVLTVDNSCFENKYIPKIKILCQEVKAMTIQLCNGNDVYINWENVIDKKKVVSQKIENDRLRAILLDYLYHDLDKNGIIIWDTLVHCLKLSDDDLSKKLCGKTEITLTEYCHMLDVIDSCLIHCVTEVLQERLK